MENHEEEFLRKAYAGIDVPLTEDEEGELDSIALDEEQLKHGKYPLIVE